MKKTLLSLVVCLFSFSAFPQSTTVDPNQGVSVPQFTTTFINGLTNQPKGTIVFDKDLNVIKYWNGTAWVNLTAGGGSGIGWAVNGNHINTTNTGNVGIGVNSPTAKLTIAGTAPNGSLAISGTSHVSHFNYPASGLENTFIRGGNAGSHVLINDSQGLGNVGIGTNLPTSKLDVTGQGRFTNLPVSYNNTTQEYTNGALVLSNTAYPFGFMRLDGNVVQAFSINNLTYKSTPDKLVLNPYGGNVGIGTSLPLYKFHLVSSGEQLMKTEATNGLVLFNDRTTDGQYGFLRAWTNNPFNPAGYYGLEIGVPPALNSEPQKRLLFTTNYTIRMAIMENGNIGIGVHDPSAYKLAVNGSIRAKEVVVETNWADYVFDKQFRLKPLSEVERFIEENKHLPDIPSAAEIQKNGAKLSELSTKMMQKIEELTLYSIEQNKRIEKLQAELTQLKAINR
ncbi:hypothetical protein [Emticicia sp. C21]|uniref:hypothetical protein n=1 Tax=Emticicia sp. C21 TaxID=2302915 RepID=UPI000E34591A|nr:hypothetical protein [Emticicia sp. C21]RFS15775.1 hypothetical protein D0T08_12760 [Emticicia sp. C21]